MADTPAAIGIRLRFVNIWIFGTATSWPPCCCFLRLVGGRRQRAAAVALSFRRYLLVEPPDGSAYCSGNYFPLSWARAIIALHGICLWFAAGLSLRLCLSLAAFPRSTSSG